MLYIKDSHFSIDETCRRIQNASAENKFGVFAVIDLKNKMEAKGVEFATECRIIEICNPVQAKKVLEANMSISSALPCRISVYEEAGKVKVVTLKPAAVLGLFGNPELEPAARQIEETIIRIIDTACQK
jgi:uncharacterized protein (DUF302 family)